MFLFFNVPLKIPFVLLRYIATKAAHFAVGNYCIRSAVIKLYSK